MGNDAAKAPSSAWAPLLSSTVIRNAAINAFTSSVC
jgi:hypothetical protein